MLKVLRGSWARIRHAGFALLFTLLFQPVMAHGPGNWGGESTDGPEAALAGKHFLGDGMGYNVELHLKADGTYVADWLGCMGRYGTARGQWRLDGEVWEILFEPASEEGAMVGHLTSLLVMDAGGEWVMVRPERMSELMESGVNEGTVFQRLEILEKKWAAGASAQSDED